MFRSSIELGLRSSSWKRSTTNRARDEAGPTRYWMGKGRPREEEEEERDKRDTDRRTDTRTGRQAQRRVKGRKVGGDKKDSVRC